MNKKSKSILPGNDKTKIIIPNFMKSIVKLDDGGIAILDSSYLQDKTNLPNKYIINNGATILFWNDGSKTIVKRSKSDAYNKRLGFLTAYFQKTSGLSKNKANKYLKELVDQDDENIEIVEINNAFSSAIDNMIKSLDKMVNKNGQI